PTASLPDIIFQLLIFFMVSTVLREYTGLKVELPEAVKIEKLPSRRHVSTIWIDKLNNVVIDDVTVKDVSKIENIAWNKLNEDKQLVFSLKVDVEADMGKVIDVQQQLRKANGLRINYSAIPAAL
ncbi:MAG: biopolymer transporter ExbD, partial [Aliifodinibius sp.]|nr:biopolymer transporter ExbD [Fodinibius sp.]NIV13467.1 biopolymer transporter ExbD [Fodinibius sp.]NIY28549.1 biopolymer transporter ExbD [Fodinibius sp.]